MMRRILVSSLAIAFSAFATAQGPDAPAAQRMASSVFRMVPDVMPTSDPTASILFWSEERRNAAFRNMEAHFPGLEVAPAHEPRNLAKGDGLPPDMVREIRRFMHETNVAGFMVLRDGRIELEEYALGFTRDQRWTSFSVAKSFTSTLLGAAVADGSIDSLDNSVTDYVPELAGTVYDGVTVGQVGTMTSGVRWNENYADPHSDVARMLMEPPVKGEPQAVTYARRLKRDAPAGSKWVYNTLETNLLGLIVERATGKHLARYAAETIVPAAGFEGGLFWMQDLTEANIGGCCLSLRLSDYARFGQWVLEGGNGVVPDGWYAKAGSALVETPRPGFGYGYQWWTYPRQLFGAQGIFGQYVTISPQDKLVLAMVSNWPIASSPDRRAVYLDLVEKIRRSSAVSDASSTD